MIKAAVYLPAYNEKLAYILRKFANGINASGDSAKMVTLGEKIIKSDVAVIFGSYKYSYQVTMDKKNIMDRYKGNKLVMIESAFTKRGEYYQIGLGGFAGDADFKNENSPKDRWQLIGVKTKPWKRREGPVIVCGQLPHDTQVQNVDHVKWCQETFNYYREKEIHVLFRPHPRCKDNTIYGIDSNFFDLKKLKFTLHEAKCFVTWNSTSAVDALIAGVPVITCNKSSISWPVSSHTLDIEQLKFPSRRQFFRNLGYTQWTIEEIEQGYPWRHLMK